MSRVWLVAIIIAMLAIPTVGQPARQRGVQMTAVRRAVLVVSIGQATVDRLDDKQLAAKVRELAGVLRRQAGVRQVQAVWFGGWRDGAREQKPPDPKKPPRVPDPPWRPYGAVVVVEASSPDILARRISNIFQAAVAIDQEMIVMNALDDW